MFDLNIDQYVPPLSEVPAEKIQEVLSRMRDRLATEAPELKTSPDSTWGNLFLRPFAELVASYEVGTSRVFSDILLERVAAGEIYNCDFVLEFLKNYGITDTLESPSVGTIRFTFTRNLPVVIDRGVLLLFGSDTVLNLVAPFNDPIKVLPSSEIPAGPNEFALVQTGINSFAFEMTAIGIPATQIDVGDTGAIDRELPYLSSITAQTPFRPGTFSEKVPELAALAQTLFSSATLTTRSGAVNYVTRIFPYISAVSSVISGDLEMQRDKANILGISDGRADICVRDSETTREIQVQIPVGLRGDAWVGNIQPPSVALEFKGVEGVSSGVIAGSVNRGYPNRFPGCSASYSTSESLGLHITGSSSLPVVQQGFFTHGTQDIPLMSNAFVSSDWELQATPELPGLERSIRIAYTGRSDDNQIAYFSVEDNKNNIYGGTASYDINQPTQGLVWTNKISRALLGSLSISVAHNPVTASQLEGAYLNFTAKPDSSVATVTLIVDPAINQVSAISSDPEEASVVDTHVRGFVPCRVTELVVKYRRKQGTAVNREDARAEIARYINTLGYPRLYEHSAITDIMLYNGASGVSSISQQGFWIPLLGNHKFDDEVVTHVPVIPTSTLRADSLEVSNANVEYLNNLNIAIGPRNAGYLIDPDVIVFQEVSV